MVRMAISSKKDSEQAGLECSGRENQDEQGQRKSTTAAAREARDCKPGWKGSCHGAECSSMKRKNKKTRAKSGSGAYASRNF
jgi:hypothetical protein